MKKLIMLLGACLMLFPAAVYGTNSSGHTGTPAVISSTSRTITWDLTASDNSGAFSNTTTNTANTAFIKGWYLYAVEALPYSGGTAPDPADVFVFENDGTLPQLDLLGSEDNGTTAYNGLNLISATLKRCATPDLYIPRGGVHVPFFPAIKSALTIKISNHTTNSAQITLILTFVK